MDWDAWARKAEHALCHLADGGWFALFADGGTFEDPESARTTELGPIQEQTLALFPDWRQEITSIRGGEGWAVWEWVGTGTFNAAVPVRMEGATIVEVDDQGLVTMWRDYLDRKAVEQQIRAGLTAGAPGPAAGPR